MRQNSAARQHVGHRTKWIFTNSALVTNPMTPAIAHAVDCPMYSSDVVSERPLMAEVLEVDPFVIEAQLAHAVKDANGFAYSRTQFRDKSRQMMQRWAGR